MMKSFYNLLTLGLVISIGVLALDSPFGSSLVEASQDKSPLRYEFKKDQKLAYNVEIFADLPREEKYYDGKIYYDVEDAGKPFRLKCTGGLSQGRGKIKRDYNGGIDLPSMHRFLPWGSAFSLSNLSSTIEIAPDGKVLKVKGSRHIPYLLGDVSTLVFEKLDGSKTDAWTLKRDMAVSEVSLFFHGFGHFGRSGTETVSSANETQSFKLLKKRGDGLLDFEKTYRFETVCDEGKFILEGKGTWTFNQKLGMSEALEMKYELINEQSNVSIKIPLKVKYTRFSDEELAKLVQKEKEQKEKIRKLNEKRNAPVTPEDQARYIQALTSGDKDKVREALEDLSSWHKATPNEELADAIRPLLESGSSFENSMAERALAKFCLKAKLEEAYSRMIPLDDKIKGPSIQKSAKLPVGLIVAAKKQRTPWYFPAKVVQAINDREYYVEFNFAGPFKDRSEKVIVEWSDICLAPRELEQPGVDSAELEKLYGAENLESKKTVKSYQSTKIARMQGFRTWTDSSGTFQVVAKYIKADEKSVELQREDGRKLKVPLNRLSKEDQKVAEQLRSLPSNPFESNPFE